MIKINKILGLILLFLSFILGLCCKHVAHKQEINDIEQVAIEACEIRIQAIKSFVRDGGHQVNNKKDY